MFIRYAQGIPQISVSGSRFRRSRTKLCSSAITAQTAARDRLMTPLGNMMTGVEIHAQAYETLAHGQFLTTASLTAVGDGVPGAYDWPAEMRFRVPERLDGLYWSAFVLLVIAHLTPTLRSQPAAFFLTLRRYGQPGFRCLRPPPGNISWSGGSLRKSESDKARYQQAIHL